MCLLWRSFRQQIGAGVPESPRLALCSEQEGSRRQEEGLAELVHASRGLLHGPVLRERTYYHTLSCYTHAKYKGWYGPQEDCQPRSGLVCWPLRERPKITGLGELVCDHRYSRGGNVSCRCKDKVPYMLKDFLLRNCGKAGSTNFSQICSVPCSQTSCR